MLANNEFITPEEYKPKLRKAKDIRDWLTEPGPWSRRGGYNYDGEAWMFCFNVKVPPLDWSFEVLLENYRVNCAAAAFDPIWVSGCRQMWEEQGEDEIRSQLFEGAAEACRSTFIGYRRAGDEETRGKPDDDGWNHLYDGTPVEARFAFMGRSGGWLVLTEFDTNPMTLDLDLGMLSYPQLVRLYKYVLMLCHDVTRPKIVAELTYQAASTFFAHYCMDVESPEAERQQRIHQAAINLAFCEQHIERPVRRIDAIPRRPKAFVDETPVPRRRIGR